MSFPEDEVYENFPTIIIDQNYILRQPTISDEDILSIYKIYNDPDVIKFVPDGCIPHGIDGAKDECKYYSNMFLLRKSMYWFVARRDTNETIGTCGFCECDRYNSRIEISYNIRSDYFNQGIMTKVVAKAINYAFKFMNARKVHAQLDPTNHTSIHLLKKLGLSIDGILRQHRFYKYGKHVDVVSMSILNEEVGKSELLIKYKI